jgi:thioredoxin-like negative regulator of GroEL
MLERKTIDFLYWHAVTKMRASDFEGAGVLFKLLRAAAPERCDVGLGHAYSLLRDGEVQRASEVVAELRRRLLKPDEMALLSRLHRRCEFEASRTARQQASAVRLRAARHEVLQ